MFLLNCYPILSGFTVFISQEILLIGPDGYKAIHEFKKQTDLIETCITKLIQFCNNKLQGMIGIDNHYGGLQMIRQRMIKEQNFFEVLTSILEIALRASDYENIGKVMGQKEKIRKKIKKGGIDLEMIRLKHIIRIIEKIYDLLTILCKKNHENQVFSYKFFYIFIKHAGLGLGANEFMLSVLRDNEELMLSINNPYSIEKSVDVIDHFITALYNSQKDQSIHSFEFLMSVCVYKGQGVTANQEKIFKSITADNFLAEKALIQTVIERNTLCIIKEGVSIPIESCFEAGIILNGYDSDVLYFTKMLELYANMCVGRNFEVFAELSNKFPFGSIQSLMWNSKICDELRGVFCKLLLNLYVDRSPREEISKPQFIKELKKLKRKEDNFSIKDESWIDKRKKRKNFKVSDETGENVLFLSDNENCDESLPFDSENCDIYNLLENIFCYFEAGPEHSQLTCEILRLTAKLVKFELFGSFCTDFVNEKLIVLNPLSSKTQELDIVRVLKLVSPLIFSFSEKNASVEKSISNVIVKDDDYEANKALIHSTSLLQETDNVKAPLIRSASNLINYISSYKQNPFTGIETRSIENKIKLKVCKMLHYYLDTRQEFLLNNIIAWFLHTKPKKIEKNELENLLPTIMKFSLDDTKFKKYSKNLFFNHFSCIKGPLIPDLNALASKPLIPILLKSFVYCDNYKLQSNTLSLIIRCYEQRKELLRHLSMVHPVYTDHDIELLFWLKINVKTFKSYSEQSEL